jgi:hypothetical protein
MQLPSAEPEGSGNAAPPSSEHSFSEDGVDLTLVHWMLSLTPAERLQVLQRHVRSVLRLRHDNPQL